MELTLIQYIAIFIIPMLFAITMHEVAHGWVASWFGDHTARLSGRLSLNPLKHIDLIGTIIVPLIMLLLVKFIFGWAKPVPVDPRNLHHPRRDMAFVALAGPIANLLMAIGWGGMAKLGDITQLHGNTWIGVPLHLMGSIGLQINVVLAVLNLLPIPPLDGAKILASILPRRAAYYFSLLEPYSFLILILLIVTGSLSLIMWPLIRIIILSLSAIYGTSFIV